MFSINGEKTLGLDGFSAHFFKVVWTTIGKDVSEAVMHFFFQTKEIYLALNSTIVTLVPKCQNPSSIQDFRLISCCFVIYKCIIKILADRLKSLCQL